MNLCKMLERTGDDVLNGLRELMSDEGVAGGKGGDGYVEFYFGGWMYTLESMVPSRE